MAAESESVLIKAIYDQMPTVTVIWVKDALEAVSKFLVNLTLAIHAAGIVAIVSDALALGGAISAGRHARIYDAVILKTFGATRRLIIFSYLSEFAILGAITALFAIVAGSIAAYFVLVEVMEMEFTFFTRVAGVILAVGIAATVSIGLAGTWSALGAKVALILRSP